MEKEKIGKIKATIKDAKIRKISDIFKRTLHKPKGLSFADTDAVIIELKVNGKTVTETFYCCIAANGTLNTSVASKEAQRRSQRIAQFVRAFISKDPDYNIREEISNWKGKKVTMLKSGKDYLL